MSFEEKSPAFIPSYHSVVLNMDIAYMKTGYNSSNDSSAMTINFIDKYPVVAIPYLIVISAFTLSGCIGNTMVIGAVLTYKPLRTVGNVFVVNLALADLCVTGFVNPFSIIGVIKGEPWFVRLPVLCSVIGTVCVVSCSCSLLNIMAISIDRYVHICKNQKYIDLATKQNALSICIGLWIISLIIQIPNHFGWNNYNQGKINRYDKKNLGCLWDRLHPNLYFHISFASFVAIATMIIICCYYQIFTYAKMCKTMVKNVSKNGSSEKDNSLQLAKTLCIIFVVFAVCWTPHTTMVIADRADVIPLPIHLYAVLFAHLNSSINCIIYGLTNKQFRTGYMKLMGLDKLRRDHPSAKSDSRSNTTLTSLENSTS